jgi:hypothetical protein
MSNKETKSGKCQQCERLEDEIMRFSENEKFRCSYCMRVEGLCQNCGEYVPLQENDENCDYDMNFAPSICDDCSS